MNRKALRIAILLVLAAALLLAAGKIVRYGPLPFPDEASCIAAVQGWYELQTCPPGTTKVGGWGCTPTKGRNPLVRGMAMYSCREQISPAGPRR
ncbi:MAG: hypothetical protein IT158_14550 [Bryobacterales bacterium]|nr:hypothetical protein [Bryobacterales bacterium]